MDVKERWFLVGLLLGGPAWGYVLGMMERDGYPKGAQLAVAVCGVLVIFLAMFWVWDD